MEHVAAAFRVSRAGAPGFTPDELRGSRFTAPFRGVRVLGEMPDDLRTRSLALAVASPSESFLCGPSAACVLRLPLDNRLAAGDPTIATAAERTHLHRRGITGRRLDVTADELMWHESVRVTTPVRTVIDLARDLPIPDIVAAGDVAMREWGATLDQFTRVLNRRLRYAGKVRARDALPLLDSRSESPQESRARAIIALSGLPVPTPQVVVRDANGRFIARVDLGFEECRLALEYQGAHHWTVQEYRADARRRSDLRSDGWTVLEIVAEDLVRSPDTGQYPVVDTLSRTLTQLDAWPLVGHRILKMPRQGARHRPWV